MSGDGNKNMVVAKTYHEVTPLDEGTNSLRRILYIIFRHQKKIITFFMAVVISTALITFLMPETYQSDAKLLIKVGRESVSMDPSVVGPTMSVYQNRESEVNSEVATLRSRIIAEQVVDTMGLEAILTGFSREEVKSEESLVFARQAAVTSVMENFSVGVEKNSSIINLSYRGNSPFKAQEVLENMVVFYLDRHIDVHKAQASPEFFRGKLDALLSDLGQKEDALKSFKAKHAISSMEDQKGKLLEQITLFQREIDAASSQIAASQARADSIRASLNNRSPRKEISRVTGRTNNAADTIKSRLIELRMKEADLAARYPENDRGLLDVQEQIRLAVAALAEEMDTHTEVTTGIDTNYQSMQLALDTEQAQLKAQVALKNTLEGKLGSRRAELEALMSHEITLQRLERDVEIANIEYRDYRDNQKRAAISAELDKDKVSNISIVQPATLFLDPIKPNKKLNLALGVLLGLFGGIGLAFFVEYFDGSLKTPEEVKGRLGLPVLVSISSEEYESCT